MTTGIVSTRSVEIGTDSILRPKAEGYGARIGSLWVRLAVTPDNPLRYYTKDSLADRQDQRGITAQNVLDIGYAWARTELDGGEGLDWDPRELPVDAASAANDVRRYWDSVNLDISSPPAGHPYTLSLSKVMEDWSDGGVVGTPKDIAVSDQYIFVADGDQIRMYSSWATASSVRQLGAGVIMVAAAGGAEAMAVDVLGHVWHQPRTGTFTQIYTAPPLMRAVWFVKGRFVGYRSDSSGENGELGEVASDGTFTVFDTTGEDAVHSVVSTGPSIVAAVGDGTVRSYVPEQSNQADPTSVNLVIRGRTDMPKGEIPYVLGASGSVLTILTMAYESSADQKTSRFYRAEALSSQYDYVVGGLQLQREWFDTGESINVQDNMSSVRDAIFFTMSESDGNSYVWRYDLVTLGLSRHNTVGATRTATFATVVFDGQGAVIDNADGEGGDTIIKLVSLDTFNEEGYLISPNITFGLNTDIAWIATVLEGFQVSDADARVELWRSTDPEAILDPNDPSWIRVSTLSRTEQSGVELPLLGISSRTLALQLKFFSRNGLVTPQITRTASRGIPQHRDWMVHLPVNVSDYVEVPGRMPLHVPGMGDTLHSKVLSLVGDHLELAVLDPPLLFTGVVDNIDEPVTYVSDRGSVSVYVTIQFRGQRKTSTVFPSGSAAIGMSALGVSTIGINQAIAGA